MPNRRLQMISRILYGLRAAPLFKAYRAQALVLLVIAALASGAFLPSGSASAAEAGRSGLGTATVSVIGNAGRGVLLAPTAVELQDGDTAYSVLERALPGKVRASGSGETLYVSSIDGLSELDLGPTSGWMYEVGGVYPTGSASLYKLKPGDAVVWRYTLDLGADLNAAGNGAAGGTSSGANGGSASGFDPGPDIAALRKRLLAKPAAELSEWEAFALGRSGGGVPAAYLSQLAEQVKAAGGKYRKATDLERIVLAIRAAGGDPRAFAGYDLVAAVYNHGNLTLQGANGPIFALLALDGGGYAIPAGAEWTRAKLVDWLLALQNGDGSFPLSPGEAGNADMTAMAIAALAPYGRSADGGASNAEPAPGAALGADSASSAAGTADASEAIARAAAYLSSVQLPTGGFKLENEANSETAAQVVIGLTAAGLDPDGTAFVKPGGSLLQALLAYRTADGGFAHAPGGGADPIATEQALLAMIAYHRFADGAPGLYRIAAERFADETLISGWAADAVHQAFAAKLMSGTSAAELRFEPKRAITRAEFAALIVRLAGDRVGKSAPAGTVDASAFADVSPSAWYYKDVMRAAASGIVNGMTASSFKPGAAVTREQMAVMIGRAFGLSASAAGAWKDASRIRPTALPYVNAVAASGILLGSGGFFDPAGQVTREMAAVAAIRMQSQGLIS